jgi:hypothetical protein
MKTLARLLLIAILGAAPCSAAWAKTPKSPVVVELFTAQGCASCKTANRLIGQIADRRGFIVLTWSVDYWDYLGWKDTFAQPAFAARQRAFARRLGPTDVYTPQVVVDGAGQVSGDDDAAVEALIGASEIPLRGRPRIEFRKSGRVSVGAGRAHGRADVWLVRYDPREQDVEVTAGENRGATVVHRNVVRQIVRLGAWSGHAATFAPPPPTDKQLVSVVIVQRARGGPIIGVAEARRRKP